MSKKFHEICDLMASPLSGVQAPDKTFLYLSNNPYTNSNAASVASLKPRPCFSRCDQGSYG